MIFDKIAAMVGLLDYKSKPFANIPLFDHSKSRGFRISNTDCIHANIVYLSNKQLLIKYFSGQVNRLVGKRVVSKFAYDGVKEVHKRRYLLQPIAVEVFCSDGQNQFLAFAKSVRPKVSLPEKS